MAHRLAISELARRSAKAALRPSIEARKRYVNELIASDLNGWPYIHDTTVSHDLAQIIDTCSLLTSS